MRVAAWQAPLLPPGSMDALDMIRAHVGRCEAEGISFLCCPEAMLGGLADYADDPAACAIPAGRLNDTLAPLSSDTVTTIVGFTELAHGGQLYNSAAVFHRGAVAGVYRKLRPAINRSVYEAGGELPVFTIGALTFGILICNDSNYPELARDMAGRGATGLFVPTNNGMPRSRDGAELVDRARYVDVATAVENRVWVVRADVAGRAGILAACGSSGIVDPNGTLVRKACELNEDVIVAKMPATS